MSTNKISKYLLYALGEILLVVIGILIALGINSWNEERKNIDKSREYLSRMIGELERNQKTLNDDSKRALQLRTYLVSSIDILTKNTLTKPQRDTLDFVFVNYNQFVRIPQSLTTFEEMKSNGHLGLIYNQELSNSINSHLTFLTAISKIYDQIANEFSRIEIFKKNLTYIITDETVRVSYDFHQIRGDQYLINTLSSFARNWQTKEGFSKRLSVMSENLATEIKKVLQEY